MATETAPLGYLVDENLIHEFDKTAEEIGMSSTAALTVFMKRFVSDGGFPFAVRKPIPNEAESCGEIETRGEVAASCTADGFDELIAAL